MEGVVIFGFVLLGLWLLEILIGLRGKVLIVVYEVLVNIVGCFLQLFLEVESGQEDVGVQKLDGVREECVNENFCVFGSFGVFDEMKVEKFEVKINDLVVVSFIIF